MPRLSGQWTARETGTLSSMDGQMTRSTFVRGGKSLQLLLRFDVINVLNKLGWCELVKIAS